MANNRINLSENEIFEKDFKTAMSGYKLEEVDEFIDLIIKDYETFTQRIDNLHQELEQLKNHVKQPRSRATANNQQVNYDVIKRLINLEKAVFNQRSKSVDM